MHTSDATATADARSAVSPDDRTSLCEWFRVWEAHIRDVDMDAALPMFSSDVVGFGSSNRLLSGRAELHGRQWSPTWPNIAGFTFLLDQGGFVISADRCTATGFVPFSSTGFAEEGGTPFDRPGRCTVVLVRRDLDDPWSAVHTHFSLVPGTPLRTVRPRDVA